MKKKLCRRIADQMLEILGIVTAEKCKGAFTEITMNIFRGLAGFVFPHDDNIFLYKAFSVFGCLSHEPLYRVFMVLR